MTEPVFRPLAAKALRRLISSAYAKWFSVFAIAQALFLVGVAKKWIPGSFSMFGVEDAQTAFFIASVHLLLFVNTFAFLLHVAPVVSCIHTLPDLSVEEAKQTKAAFHAFIVFTGFSIFLCGAV